MEAGGRQPAVRPSVAGLAVLGLLLVVGSLPLASADYLQASVDAARTGVTSDVGPARDDVAFKVDLPGSMPSVGPPLIVDGSVYASLRAVDVPGLEMDGIARVDLATAEVEILVETGSPPLTMASDGDLLYVVTEAGVDAYPLNGGAPAWSWEREPLTNLPPDRTWCRPPAVTDGGLYLLCFDIASGASLMPFWEERPEGIAAPPPPAVHGEFVASIASVDLGLGEPRWVHVLSTGQEQVEASGGPGLHEPRVAPFDFELELGGISVIDGLAIASIQQPSGGGFGEATVHAVGTEDGSAEWRKTVSVPQQAVEGSEGDDQVFLEDKRPVRAISPPTGTSQEVYYVVEDLAAIHHGSGAEVWRHPLVQPDPDVVGGNVLALSGDDLYVAAMGVLFKFDRTGQSVAWERVNPVGEHFDDQPLILAGDILYARTHIAPELTTQDQRESPESQPNAFYAYDPAEGRVLWKHQVHQEGDRFVLVPGNQFTYGVAAGVMAIQGVDGTLRILGTTAASLVPATDVSDTYPDVREEVRVDLSATEPGIHGPATEYRAAWGDGTVTAWQSDPVMLHTYASDGERLAEFSVRNDAGQTATTTTTFHVGETPPNFLSTAFAPENQDMTFGVLGVALALAGGGIGMAARRRKRTRLQDELESLEQGYNDTRDQPGECAAFLAARRAHARSLMLDGHLREDQFALLEKRVEELERGLRTSVLDARFSFLPHGMVDSMKKTLADGRLNAWEREALHALLDREEGLSASQKHAVREQLDAWFREDTEGEAP